MAITLTNSLWQHADFVRKLVTVSFYLALIKHCISAWEGVFVCAAKPYASLDSGGRVCNASAYLRSVYQTSQNLALSEWHSERYISDGRKMEEGAVWPKIAWSLAVGQSSRLSLKTRVALDPAARGMTVGHV